MRCSGHWELLFLTWIKRRNSWTSPEGRERWKLLGLWHWGAEHTAPILLINSCRPQTTQNTTLGCHGTFLPLRKPEKVTQQRCLKGRPGATQRAPASGACPSRRTVAPPLPCPLPAAVGRGASGAVRREDGEGGTRPGMGPGPRRGWARGGEGGDRPRPSAPRRDPGAPPELPGALGALCRFAESRQTRASGLLPFRVYLPPVILFYPNLFYLGSESKRRARSWWWQEGWQGNWNKQTPFSYSTATAGAGCRGVCSRCGFVCMKCFVASGCAQEKVGCCSKIEKGTLVQRKTENTWPQKVTYKNKSPVNLPGVGRPLRWQLSNWFWFENGTVQVFAWGLYVMLWNLRGQFP